jgi:hypothetical protein
MQDGLAAVGPMTGQWADFFILVGAFVLVAIGALIWILYFRKTRRKRKRRHSHRHGQRSINPTLAETGGLPPARPPEPPDGTPSQSP